MGTSPMAYIVFNATDGLPAFPEIFPTNEAARDACQKFRDRIRRLQGHYLTTSGQRIDPNEVDLRIEKQA